MKRTRINPKRSTARRRLAPQEDSDWWTWATMELLGRCGSRCEKCGRPLGDRMERHHRQRRRSGGDRLSNLMAVHPECHAWITEHPEAAREAGWIVSAEGLGGVAPDPAEIPVRLPDGYLWLLRDDGRKTPFP